MDTKVLRSADCWCDHQLMCSMLKIHPPEGNIINPSGNQTQVVLDCMISWVKGEPESTHTDTNDATLTESPESTYN